MHAQVKDEAGRLDSSIRPAIKGGEVKVWIREKAENLGKIGLDARKNFAPKSLS